MTEIIDHKAKEAIEAIVTYNTLPPQIDYVLPWLSKSNKGLAYLESLSQEEMNKAFEEIEKRINEYFDSEAAKLNAMF